MVGGIDGDHDGFSGRNYQGNNVTVTGCIFTNNIAKTKGQTSSFCVKVYKLVSEGGYVEGQPRYNKYGNTYVEVNNGDYYLKHDDVWFYPKGNAGAVYVYGNDTKIIDCTFENNNASANGSALYILGQRTIVENSRFYNNSADVDGAIYIEGNDVKIKNSKFEDNEAVNGSAIYILGSRTEISLILLLKITMVQTVLFTLKVIILKLLLKLISLITMLHMVEVFILQVPTL